MRSLLAVASVLCLSKSAIMSQCISLAIRVCAYAQRDGRPRNIGGAVENHEERKFRILFLYYATKFGSRPLFECRAVMLPM